MWYFGIWISRHGVVGQMVGLHDLRGLFQPMILWFLFSWNRDYKTIIPLQFTTSYFSKSHLRTTLATGFFKMTFLDWKVQSLQTYKILYTNYMGPWAWRQLHATQFCHVSLKNLLNSVSNILLLLFQLLMLSFFTYTYRKLSLEKFL